MSITRTIMTRSMARLSNVEEDFSEWIEKCNQKPVHHYRRVNIVRQFPADSIFYLYGVDVDVDNITQEYDSRVACGVIKNNKIVEVYPRFNIAYNNLEEWIGAWPVTKSIVRDGAFWSKNIEKLPITMYRQMLE
jgi:hypothetical protein